MRAGAAVGLFQRERRREGLRDEAG